MVRTGATFADAAAEWVRFIAEDRERKPSTVRDYRHALEARLLPAFGSTPIEDIDVARIEVWRHTLDGLSSRSKNKLLLMLHGIFRRAQTVYGLQANPLARIEKHPQRVSGGIEVFGPEEVWALVRAAASDQDGALFLTAAFSGLRLGELLALCWRGSAIASTGPAILRHYALRLASPPGVGRAMPGTPFRSPTSISPGRNRPASRGGRRRWVSRQFSLR